MQELEIDYSQVQSVNPTVAADESWEAPPHKYFGPKDPKNGKRLPEPVYVHQEYPRMMYAKEGGKIVAKLVKSDEEKEKLGADWKKNPGELGYIGAPSFDQVVEMRRKAEQGAKTGEKTETLHLKKS